MADPGKINDIRSQVQARIKEESEGQTTEPPPTGGNTSPPVDSRFVRKCLKNNERGDGMLYAALFRGQYICNLKERDAKSDKGTWYFYNGQHWELDKRMLSHNAVEEVAIKYLQEAERLEPLIEDVSNKLQEANQRVKNANKKAKLAEKIKDISLQQESDTEGITAETESAKHKQELISLRSEYKEFNRRVDKLRGCSGIVTTLTMAHRIGPQASLSIIGNEFDKKPWLLACKNGTIDLRTGKLLQGNPEDFLLRAVPYEYKYDPDYLLTGENSPCPTWDKFLEEIHQGNQEILSFVQRLIGYGITGLTTEHFIGVFTGAGRNGKGTMFEMIKNILGELAWAIQPEMLLEQKMSRSSTGPSADMVSLYGRRFILASETDEGKKISSSMVKRLTGGDTLAVRSPFDKYEWDFEPTHTLYLYTNDLPYGLTRDFALRQRLVLIDYPLRYVDDPELEAKSDPANSHLFRLKDKTLPAKLKEEAPGILQALVQYCLLWQRDGLSPPQSVRDAIEQHNKEEDNIGQFLSECIITEPEELNEYPEPAQKETFKAIYGHFNKWWEEYHAGGRAKICSKKAFGKYLKTKGFEMEQSNGRLYRGLKIRDIYQFSE